MPFKTAAGETYDSGEFAKVMDDALEEADWGGFAKRRAEAAGRGRRRGIGMAYYIESTMGDPQEAARIEFADDGMVNIVVGTQSNGQGHETAYAQVLNDRLGIPFEKIRVVQGDTAKLKWGGGTGGSRSLTAEGMAIRDASDIVIERGKHYASQELETAIADIEFAREAGEFRVVGTDRSIALLDLAAKARTLTPPAGAEPGLPGLDAEAMAKIDAWTFPNGCHVCEVELDPDTGAVRIVNYVAVDDFGVVVNPMLVAGQVHGGVVQGIGQALMEQAVYDDAGQLLTGSFMDYAMPHAADMPVDARLDHRGPVQEQPDGRQGLRRGGLGRLARRGDQRADRRAGRPRRARARHAGDAAQALAADPGAPAAGRGGVECPAHRRPPQLHVRADPLGQPRRPPPRQTPLVPPPVQG